MAQTTLAKPMDVDMTKGAEDSSADPHASEPLRSVHTKTFCGILTELACSLVVTTYQAGRLMLLRSEGNSLNTHFRRFPRPMGLAVHAGRVAVGAGREVVELYNMRAVTEKLDPADRHDACYLPRHSHITGDIDIHEMGFARPPSAGHASAEAELWIVNTRFSCLCTLDHQHSFVPRWRPKFISTLAPDDRCHLNGMCVIDGRPRYVSALGEGDTAAAWRERKADGGVLIDVESDEVICRGLSMPHSPRWYAGQLWLLESGDGSLGTVDMRTGQYEAVIKFDGFTRGLSFCGPFAFVGLSQVRESAVFSGVRIADQVQQRTCGIAIVHLPTGRQVGFVHFQDAVQEIFAVEVLPHRFPELLEPSDDLVALSYALPEDALREIVHT